FIIDRKVRGSNPTSVSRLLLSRFGQLDSISSLVLHLGVIAPRHQKRVTVERLFNFIFIDFLNRMVQSMNLSRKYTAWWTQKVKEVQEAQDTGNAMRLFLSISAAGPWGLSVSESIRYQTGAISFGKEGYLNLRVRAL
ncbi:hypothetical protein T265_14267, partial [Opisthorchis viverrini]